MDSKISKRQDSNNNLQRQASEASLDMSELFNEPTNRTNHDAKANVLSSLIAKLKNQQAHKTYLVMVKEELSPLEFQPLKFRKKPREGANKEIR